MHFHGSYAYQVPCHPKTVLNTNKMSVRIFSETKEGPHKAPMYTEDGLKGTFGVNNPIKKLG